MANILTFTLFLTHIHLTWLRNTHTMTQNAYSHNHSVVLTTMAKTHFSIIHIIMSTKHILSPLKGGYDRVTRNTHIYSKRHIIIHSRP